MVSLNVLPSEPLIQGRRLPPWLKRPLPLGNVFSDTKRIVAESRVATVCEEARCPNLSECWSKKHATFMILGELCTRRCHYCAVTTAKPDPPEADEPFRLADAVAKLSLKHVVITAVARDDLPDEGAGHFADCVREIRRLSPETTIEVLPADFHARRECIQTLCDAAPEIYNHNLEMVERLQPVIRPKGGYNTSLDVLVKVKVIAPHIVTKSGIMVGLGETDAELEQTLRDLHAVGCDVLTIGQYLRPSDKHAPVRKFYEPAEFDALADFARAIGFLSVASGPFVRSSYNAEEVFEETKRRLALLHGQRFLDS
jgi:lipoic acid synthetase